MRQIAAISAQTCATGLGHGYGTASISRGRIYVTGDLGDKSVISALDLDGRILWQADNGPAWTGPQPGSRGTPTVDGDRLYHLSALGQLVCLDAKTGKQHWGVNILMPVYHDGHLFVSAHEIGSVLLRLAVDGDRVSVEPAWRNKDLDQHHGGVVLVDGYLYGCGRFNANRWVCLDWFTGRTMYQARGVGKGSLTYADGLLYTRGENGRMGLVQATPDGHQMISQFTPPQGEGPAWAHPVVCDGRLYLRHGDLLLCYDVRQRP